MTLIIPSLLDGRWALTPPQLPSPISRTPTDLVLYSALLRNNNWTEEAPPPPASSISIASHRKQFDASHRNISMHIEKHFDASHRIYFSNAKNKNNKIIFSIAKNILVHCTKIKFYFHKIYFSSPMRNVDHWSTPYIYIYIYIYRGIFGGRENLNPLTSEMKFSPTTPTISFLNLLLTFH